MVNILQKRWLLWSLVVLVAVGVGAAVGGAMDGLRFGAPMRCSISRVL
jgi:hypothetical protein